MRWVKISVNGTDRGFDVLLERLKNGDQSAFDQIYNRCYAHLLFVCKKFCYSKEDAEEVVNDVFHIAYRKADELRGDTLLAYLRKVAVHASYRKRKENRQHYEYTVPITEHTEDVTELATEFLPEEYLADKQMRSEIMQMIDKLPKTQREMVYMYYYVDINSAEIAKLQGCSQGHVRKTLFKAKNAIKAQLKGTKAKAIVPLGALILAEEAAFAAGYVAVAATITAGAGTVAAVAAKSAVKAYVIAYVIAACVTVGAAVTGIYLWHTATEPDSAAITAGTATGYERYDSRGAITYYMAPVIPTTEQHAQGTTEPELAIGYENYDNGELDIDYSSIYHSVFDEPSQESVPAEPATEYEGYANSQADPYEEPAPGYPQFYESEEPIADPEPQLAYPADNSTPSEEEPTEPYTPAPHDPTQQILAALSMATTAYQVNDIMDAYNFTHFFQIRHSDEELFRFYVVNWGSGDILIGMLIGESGEGWRMVFEHFENKNAPTDMLELILFMEATI